MQGRLLPKFNGNYQAHPIGLWQKEFEIAKSIGFDCIEFILDFNEYQNNPLMNEKGVERIKENIHKYSVKVVSICADFFMINPIFLENTTKRTLNFNVLKKLIVNSNKIGVTDIVIPLVDNSSIKNNKQKQVSAAKFLKNITNYIKNNKLRISLETDLPPVQFLKFVNKINSNKIKINYDIGNSASLGYNFNEEFSSYGKLITNIHIKDREFNGGSVLLGKGNANLIEFFKYLKTYNYKGIFILQAFREDDDGITSVIPQYKFVNEIIKKYYA